MNPVKYMNGRDIELGDEVAWRGDARFDPNLRRMIRPTRIGKVVAIRYKLKKNLSTMTTVMVQPEHVNGRYDYYPIRVDPSNLHHLAKTV